MLAFPDSDFSALEETNDEEVMAANIQALVNMLSTSILMCDLEHIKGDQIVAGNPEHCINLLQLAKEISCMMNTNSNEVEALPDEESNDDDAALAEQPSYGEQEDPDQFPIDDQLVSPHSARCSLPPLRNWKRMKRCTWTAKATCSRQARAPLRTPRTSSTSSRTFRRSLTTEWLTTTKLKSNSMRSSRPTTTT